jgi:hypothetical protein
MLQVTYYKCHHDKANFYNVTCIHTFEPCMDEKTDFCIQASPLTVPDLAIRYNIATRLTVLVKNPPTTNLTHSEAVGYST